MQRNHDNQLKNASTQRRCKYQCSHTRVLVGRLEITTTIVTATTVIILLTILCIAVSKRLS
jgi:uncharacterized membrane protein